MHLDYRTYVTENGDPKELNSHIDEMVLSMEALKANALVRKVFEETCTAVVFDAKLAKQVMVYRSNFVNKNEDHVTFFGGNLLGVQTVRFSDTDSRLWFDDILQVDDQELEEKLHELPDINPEFNVSSDTFNLSCIWLAYGFLNSKSLKDDVKVEAAIASLLVLQYKFLTSRLYRLFRYPAKKDIAEATYASLSNKYDIKQYGSWGAMFRGRTEDILSKESIHFKTLRYMDNDYAIVQMLNDVQGRIRNMLKNIYNEYLITHSAGTRISSTSSLVEHDGSVMLRDKNDGLANYQRYIVSVIPDKNSFYKEELTVIIQKLITTMPPRLLDESITWISANFKFAPDNKIGKSVNNLLLHAFDTMNDNKSLTKKANNLPLLLSKLKGVYTSSRSTDPILFSLREDFESYARDATDSKNDTVIASVRTGMMLYIVARTITMNHYTTAKV